MLIQQTPHNNLHIKHSVFCTFIFIYTLTLSANRINALCWGGWAAVVLAFELNNNKRNCNTECVLIYQTYYSFMMILNIKCILHYKLVNLFCIYYFVNARCQFDFIFVSNVKQNIRLTTGECASDGVWPDGYSVWYIRLPARLMIARWRSRHKMVFNSVIWHRDLMYMQVLMDINNICVRFELCWMMSMNFEMWFRLHTFEIQITWSFLREICWT